MAEAIEQLEEAEELREENLKKAGIFFSPEAIAMLSLAVIIDSEFFVEMIPYVGQVLSVILDIVGLILIGGWMLFRSGIARVPQKSAARLAKVTSWAKRLKWLRPLCVIIEMIPVASSPLPLWILVVWLELKYG